MLANGHEKQKHLCRGCGSVSARTTRAVPAHFFAITFADAETLCGTDTLRDTAKGDSRLFFGSWSEPSSCGLWLSRGLVVHTARVFDGRSLGEASQGRPPHRYRLWSQHRPAVSDSAFHSPCYHVLQPMAARCRPAGRYRLRPKIAPRHSTDPFALGSRQRAARLSRRAGVGDAPGTRVHPKEWRHGFLPTLHRHT